jgi:hypothetical protein
MLLLAGAVGTSLVLSACGANASEVGAAGTTPSSSNSPLGLAKCMRANGVPNFPDPSSSSGGNGLSISRQPGSETLTVNGVALSGPAFQTAQKACRKYLPGAGAPLPRPSAQQKQAALRFSECMRTHGVPNFPDPTFSGGSVGIVLPATKGSRPTGLNPQSPAFQHAQKACGGPFSIGLNAHAGG